MTNIDTVPQVCVPTGDSDLCEWLGQASPGEIFEYYRGHLSIDINSISSNLEARDRSALSRIARRAQWAAELGLVHLLQRRNGPDNYTYLVVARPRRAGIPTEFPAPCLDGVEGD